MRNGFPSLFRRWLTAILAGVALAGGFLCGCAWGGHGHDSKGAPATPPPPFVATTEKSFPLLMEEMMAAMDDGMIHAPLQGDPDHDFATMMIPHHQGAIDMAKVLLLYGKDPELRNLALQIIADQQNEIQRMQAWLKRHREAHPPIIRPADK